MKIHEIINKVLARSILFLVLIMLLSPLIALADEALDEALGLCHAEVQYYSLNTGKVKKVVFPNDFHLKDMPSSFIIEYRDDLKAGVYFNSGNKQPLDVRCHIQKETSRAFYVKINGKHIDTKDGKFDIPAGNLSSYINQLGDKNYYLSRKNGTTAPWPNDIEKLCREFVLYKSIIPEYSKKGKEQIDQLRGEFEATNQWLNQYHEDDVQTMLSYLNSRS